MAGRNSKDELFFQRENNNGGDSPTIEPLRINKPASPQPPRTDSGQGQRYNYPPPKQASKHSFPLPPGASSSAAPLPYPDDEGTFQYSKPQRTPYPDDEGVQRHASPQQYNSSTSPPPRTDSGQSGYSAGRPDANSRKASYDTSRRPGQSPTDQRQPGLAERRGTAPKPLPQSPGPETPNKDGYQGQQQQQRQYMAPGQQYTGHEGLIAPQPQKAGLDRYSSTASTSTTRASRGSPAPPETPIVGPGEYGGGIEQRYAASGIAGTATLTSLQAQNAAAAQRRNQYQPPQLPQMPLSPAFSPAPQQQQAPAPRPWTPTELPGDTTPHGPVAPYQHGMQLPPQPQQAQQQQQRPEHARQGSAGRVAATPSAMEQDFQRMQLADEPPPAYSSVNSGQTPQGYPNEKTPSAAAGTSAAAAAVAASSSAPVQQYATASSGKQHRLYDQPLASPALHPGHPAFANDPRPDPNATPVQGQFPAQVQEQPPMPQLPEGWIRHEAPPAGSGNWYFIHVATSHTQWEFPKGPEPIIDAPLSPSASTYGRNPLLSPGLMSPGFGGKQGLHSPMFPPQSPGYAASVMSSASMAPTAGFSGPPPTSGVDQYKIAPRNGVYFGPYLKYINMDLERGIWLGSIMVVTEGGQPPMIHIHRSDDLSPNPRQLEPKNIFTHQRWVFHRYDVDLQMGEVSGGERWTYAITSMLGCTRYEFLVASRHETNWRFIAHSGNDFAQSTNVAERSRLGGVDFMWKDVLQKNVECGGFHVQLGLGNQVYADRLWKDLPALQQWLALQGKETRKNAAWTASHEEAVSHAYFHYYTSHFDQSYLREAFAQIPHVCQIGDHEIFGGFGNYPAHMQDSQMFRNIGRIGVEMYLLFQHHTTLELLRNVSDDMDLFTITGTGWHFVKYLGPALAVVGPDVRSERTLERVMAGPTYQGLFPKVSSLPNSIQHCVWMVGTPLLYPRLDTMKSLNHTIATGKKAVNSTYNLLGKVTSTVAGVAGGREMVKGGFDSVKRAVGKGGLMGGVLNSFGEVEVGEGLEDMWTHPAKDLERTYFIRVLQGIAQQKGLRITFMSGDTNTASSSLLHDPTHPSDHKTMYQLLTSSIVAAPLPSIALKMVHSAATSAASGALYIPQNNYRSEPGTTSDTKEDLMEIFVDPRSDTSHTSASASAGARRIMARRNYIAGTLFGEDQQNMGMLNGLMSPGAVTPGGWGGVQGGKLSLAVDFIVQAETMGGAMGGTQKFGPVVVPALEFGR